MHCLKAIFIFENNKLDNSFQCQKGDNMIERTSSGIQVMR